MTNDESRELYAARPRAVPADRAGVRVVAFFEAAKGVLVVLAGFAVLEFAHGDLQSLAENLVLHLHLNPASRYPRIFLDALHRFDDVRLWTLAAGALAYASLRFVEAYGLWRDRTWGEWVGVLSGLVYVPFETEALVRGVTPLKLFTFTLNVAIVAYLALRLVGKRRQRRA